MAMRSDEVARDETVTLIGSDKVEGTAVYGADRDQIGRIDRVMLDKRKGEVAYAVMSFGGFLGIGERHHPIPWSQLTYDTALDGYVVNLTRDRLQGAPSYERGAEPDWNDPAVRSRISGYYGSGAAPMNAL